MARLILAVGGTGGHIYPSMALARFILHRLPETKVFVAGKQGGQEQRIAADCGVDFRAVRVAKAPAKKLSPAALRFGGEVLASVQSGLKTVNELKPDVVVGFGGYVSFPTVAAAVMKKIPVYIHEQNALAGKTNLLMAKFATGVFASYESTVTAFGDKALLTGNPSRYEEGARFTKEEAVAKLGLDPARRTIFVFGGSQGAVSINRAMLEFARMNRDRKDLQIIHLAGRNNYEVASGEYKKELGSKASLKVDVRDYLDEMDAAYVAADITVCRSGATSIAELTSLGVASILVPFPYATGDHQRLNALELERAGAAVLVDDSDLDGKWLTGKVNELLADPEILEEMARKASGIYMRGAAEKMTAALQKHFG